MHDMLHLDFLFVVVISSILNPRKNNRGKENLHKTSFSTNNRLLNMKSLLKRKRKKLCRMLETIIIIVIVTSEGIAAWGTDDCLIFISMHA